MANLFKVVTNATMPGTAGTSDALYTVQSNKAVIVLGLVLANCQRCCNTSGKLSFGCGWKDCSQRH